MASRRLGKGNVPEQVYQLLMDAYRLARVSKWLPIHLDSALRNAFSAFGSVHGFVGPPCEIVENNISPGRHGFPPTMKGSSLSIHAPNKITLKVSSDLC